MKNSRLVVLTFRYVKQIRFYDINPANWDLTKIIWPFRLMTHPIEVSNDIKYENKGSLALANFIALLFFLTGILKRTAFGFIFNKQSETVLNVWPVFLQTILLLILWTVTSWALCTLLDGEGKIREIWITSCYSVTPIIIFSIINVILSNILTIEESVFISALSTLMYFWSAVLLIMSTLVIQQYTLTKTLMAMFFSAVGIFAVLFLSVLVMSMFQQMFIFLNTVFKEIMYRL